MRITRTGQSGTEMEVDFLVELNIVPSYKPLTSKGVHNDPEVTISST